nr:Ig-like domain-containing protein [Streptomyces sp. SID5473]
MSPIYARGRIALTTAGVVALLGAVVGCGVETAGKEDTAPGSTGVGTAEASATGSDQGSLLLRDDEGQAVTAEELVVKVLSNDAVNLADGTGMPLAQAQEDGDVQITVESGPGSGTAKVEDGAILYTSNPDYEGQDVIHYRVTFKGAKEPMTASAELRISVRPGEK